MGYGTRPGLIRENQEWLREIKRLLALRGEVTLEVPPERGSIASEQFRIRRLLKATEEFQDECDGEFAGMGASIRLMIPDYLSRQIILSLRKNQVYSSAIAAQPTDIVSEEAELIRLRTSKSSMEKLAFKPSPSFSRETFDSQVDELGWEYEVPLESQDEFLIGIVVRKGFGEAEVSGGGYFDRV